MSRIVLLHLADSDVDLLTRAREQEDSENVVVVHPEEQSLVRRLAQIAEVTSLSSPPEAQADDLVITPNPESTPAAAAWRALGAKILTPHGFLHPEETAPPETPQAVPERERPGARLQPPPPATLASPAERAPSAPSKPPAPSHSGSGNGANGSVSLEILASPEASLDFILRHQAGEDSGITLWWDGSVGLWAPWAGTLPKTPCINTPPPGYAWPTDNGNFMLTGLRALDVDWNQGALKRVSEDLALRDLVAFSRQLVEHPLLGTAPEEHSLSRWLEAAAAFLKPTAGMAWIERDGRWQLEAVVGNGIVFSGTLKMDESLLNASFAGSQTWTCTHWGDGLKIYWQFAPDNLRWPVYLKRLSQRALVGNV